MLKVKLKVLVIISILCGFAWNIMELPYARAETPETGLDSSAEVAKWYRAYAAYWLDANVDVNAVSNYYASPFYYLGAGGPLLDTGKTQKKSLHAYIADWKKMGWAGARLLDFRVKMLNDRSAMIMTEWDIYDHEGKSIIGCDRAPWTYIASKGDKGWKLTLEIEIACGHGIVLDQ